MKVEIEFDSSFGDNEPIPIQIGRLYLGNHVVRLAFTVDGKVKMLLPKAAIDEGYVIVTHAFRDAKLVGFGYPPG